MGHRQMSAAARTGLLLLLTAVVIAGVLAGLRLGRPGPPVADDGFPLPEGASVTGVRVTWSDLQSAGETRQGDGEQARQLLERLSAARVAGEPPEEWIVGAAAELRMTFTGADGEDIALSLLVLSDGGDAWQGVLWSGGSYLSPGAEARLVRLPALEDLWNDLA